ncbi:MAG: hypothetical protein V4555_06070 [Acidobacteriota bacterium]
MTESSSKAVGHGHEADGVVRLPAPTMWPMVLATGIALVFTGMVTHWVIAVLGGLCIIPAVVGWFRDVLPHEKHLDVPVHVEVIEIASARTTRPHRTLSGD